MTVLHIDASARRDGSVTRRLSRQVVDRIAGTEAADVIRRDLADALPQIDEAWIGANFTPADDRDAEAQGRLVLSDTLVQELRDADTIVIGTPVYNFGVPAALKAWIDLVARAGVTFRYGENGPEGLLTGKRAIIAVATGGTEVGSEIDFATGYLRHILGFIGIGDIEIIAADRIMAQSAEAIAAAEARIGQLAA